MKPIALIINDTHCHEGNISLHRDIWRQVEEIVKNKNVPTVIHLGDWFVSRAAQTQNVLNEVSRVIWSSKIENLITIPGNHDKTNYRSSESFLDALFAGNPSISRSLHSDCWFEDLYGVRFHFLPYFDEHELYPEKLKWAKRNLSDTGRNVLLTHINFIDFDQGAKTIKSSVSPDAVKEFDLVISGHIHNEHKVKNIIHHPSPYQNNFGENQKKGVSILYEDLSLEFIQLDFPRYETAKVKTYKEYKALASTDSNNVQIVFEGDDEKELAKIKKAAPANYKIKDKSEREVKTDFEQIESISLDERIEAFEQKKKLKEGRIKQYYNATV